MPAWLGQILQIDHSSCVLLFVTENSISEQWLKNEVDYAIKSNKHVIPIVMTSLFYIRSAMYDVFNLYGTVYIKHDNKLHINNLISRLENIKNKLIKHLFLLKIKRPKRIPPSAAA